MANNSPFQSGKIRFFTEERRAERCLTIEERYKLFQACSDFLKPIILTALKTGMRQGEILNLKWEHVNLENATIHVSNTKSGKARDLPIHPQLLECLSTLPKNSPYVFCDNNGNPLTRYGKLRHEFEYALKKANISGFRFHDLRHTFASILAMKGVDLLTIKYYLGHSSLEMTMRYAHLLPDHKQFAIQLLGREESYPAATEIKSVETITV